MATIKQLQEWLKQFPEDAEVHVAIQQQSEGRNSFGKVVFELLELEQSKYGDGWEYCDYTTNPYVSGTNPMFKRKVLYLGESN